MELWKPVPDGAREIPPGGVCPRCRSAQVHRSRARGVVERVARALGPFRPFTCKACRWRGWRWPDTSQGPVIRLPALPDRPRRQPRHSVGQRTYSPVEAARLRHRRHLVLTVLLACLAGGALLYCQQEPDRVVEP